MITDSSPINFNDPLPTEVDVVIIGAGVIGISTAVHLARQHVRVLVCDKGRVAGEQSSRNWGWIRQQGRDADELPIVTESVGLWESYAQELDRDIGFSRQGVMFAAVRDDELDTLEQWLRVAEQQQLDTRMIGGEAAADWLGLPHGSLKGALLTPSDARAEPFVAVPALARFVQKLKGAVREDCAVRALDISAGAVTGVITEHGLVKADRVLCAAGAWSNTLLRNHDVDIPQLLLRGTVLRTGSDGGGIDSAGGDRGGLKGAATIGGLGIRRRQDGGYTIASGLTEHLVGADSFRHFTKYLPAMRANMHNLGLDFGGDLLGRLFPQTHWSADEITPFERQRVLNPPPSRRALKRIRKRLQVHLPALADLPIEQTWAGIIDAMPDIVPIMDAVPNLPGLYLATGFSAHGFGIGPGAGRVMGDMMYGRPERHDLSRFRFSRFSDGSRIQPGPGL